jgi:hypothetical protein
VTPSEEMVSTICKASFLPFWTYPNPFRRDNKKELTDVLIVCDPYVIIISVKEINITPCEDKEVESRRWYNRAIEKSYSQIYGAERIIKDSVTEIFLKENNSTISFPSLERMKIIRIGVSIGRKMGYALPFGRFEGGFIHFYDQFSFPVLFQELDTITDFVNYIEAKERYFEAVKNIKFSTECDILAIYLHRGRVFPDGFDMALVEPNVWNQFIGKDEFLKRKEQERVSYIWDRIIGEFYDGYSRNELLFIDGYEGTEQSLRVMANETRFSRMMLSESFLDAIGFFSESRVGARILESINEVTFVFLVYEHDEENRNNRIQSLGLRCLAARNMVDNSIVVGIATNRYIHGTGHSYDLYYLYKPELFIEERAKIREMQEALGYFIKPIKTMKHFDEYPI